MDGRPQNEIDPVGGVTPGASVDVVPVAPIDVDPDVYASAGTVFLQVNDVVCDLVAAAATAAGGGMAGTDSGGVAWAAGYDQAARTALRAGATLADSIGRLGELLSRSGANHTDADASSAAGGPPAYPGEGAVPAASSIIPATPPSADGTGDDPPPGWSVVAHLLSYAWPNGHQDRLRSVAAGWADAAAGLSDAADRLTGAVADVSALQSPEVDAAVATCTRVQQAARGLSAAFATLSGACSDYAGHLDDAHSQVIDELLAFAVQTVGNAIIAAQAGGGGAGGAIAAQVPQAAELARAAVRIDQILAGLIRVVGLVTRTVLAVDRRMQEVDTQLQAVLAKGATDAVAAAVAAAAPPVTPYDLAADEGPGRGHTIERHVGKSDHYLQTRPGAPTYASTFTDQATAATATAQNIAVNEAEIQAWLAGSAPRREISAPMPGPAGRIYVRATGTFIQPTTVTTVLRRTSHGYFVFTSFPDV